MVRTGLLAAALRNRNNRRPGLTRMFHGVIPGPETLANSTGGDTIEADGRDGNMPPPTPSWSIPLNRTRWLLLLAAPAPIVAGSIYVTRFCKPHRDSATGQPVMRATSSGAALASLIPEAKSPHQSAAEARLQQACQASADDLLARLWPECSALVAPPLVIAGDLSPRRLERWRRETIEPAIRGMAASYVDVLPHLPVTVLLMANERSYHRATTELFGEQGVSVFGYYKPDLRVLVMNIDTGSGTLVHELTHALLAFDFPTAPDWFNEGLASLHEQCDIRADGRGLDGQVNWRLKFLKQALADDSLRRLDALMTDGDFRRQQAVNYAHARYFCLFLQDRGLLSEFYRRFRDDWRRDPEGTATVAALFPGQTWDEIDAEFRVWATKLASP